MTKSEEKAVAFTMMFMFVLGLISGVFGTWLILSSPTSTVRTDAPLLKAETATDRPLYFYTTGRVQRAYVDGAEISMEEYQDKLGLFPDGKGGTKTAQRTMNWNNLSDIK